MTAQFGNFFLRCQVLFCSSFVKHQLSRSFSVMSGPQVTYYEASSGSKPASSQGEAERAAVIAVEPAGQQPGGDVFDQFGPGQFDLGELLGDAGSEFKARHHYLGLTWPRCPVPVDVMLDSVIACSKTILGVRGVQEHHKDGTPHCQMLVQRKAKCHDIAASAFHVDYEGHAYRCHVRHLKTRVHQARWHADLS